MYNQQNLSFIFIIFSVLIPLFYTWESVENYLKTPQNSKCAFGYGLDIYEDGSEHCESCQLQLGEFKCAKCQFQNHKMICTQFLDEYLNQSVQTINNIVLEYEDALICGQDINKCEISLQENSKPVFKIKTCQNFQNQQYQPTEYRNYQQAFNKSICLKCDDFKTRYNPETNDFEYSCDDFLCDEGYLQGNILIPYGQQIKQSCIKCDTQLLDFESFHQKTYNYCQLQCQQDELQGIIFNEEKKFLEPGCIQCENDALGQKTINLNNYNATINICQKQLKSDGEYEEIDEQQQQILKEKYGFEPFVFKQINFGEQISVRFPREIKQQQVVILELSFQTSEVSYLRVLQACNGLNRTQPYLMFIQKDSNPQQSYEERKQYIKQTYYSDFNLSILEYLNYSIEMEVQCHALYSYTQVVNALYYASNCRNGDTCLLYFVFVNNEFKQKKHETSKKKGIDFRVLSQNENQLSPIDMSFFYSKNSYNIINYDNYPKESEDPEFAANFFPVVPALSPLFGQELMDLIQPFHLYIKPDQEGAEISVFFSHYRFPSQEYVYYTIENYYDEQGNINDTSLQYTTTKKYTKSFDDRSSYDLIHCIGNEQRNNCVIIIEVTSQKEYTGEFQDQPHFYVDVVQRYQTGEKIILDANKLINCYKIYTPSDQSPYFSIALNKDDLEIFDEKFNMARFFMIGEQPYEPDYKQDIMQMKNPLVEKQVIHKEKTSEVQFLTDQYRYYSQIVTTNAYTKYVYVQINTYFGFDHYVEEKMRVETLSMDNVINEKNVQNQLTFSHNNLIQAYGIDKQYLFFYKARKGKNKITFSKTKGYIKYFVNRCENLDYSSCQLPSTEHYQYFAQHFWDQTMYVKTSNTDKEELYAILMVKISHKKPGNFPFTITDSAHKILESSFSPTQLILLTQFVILLCLPLICLFKQQASQIKLKNCKFFCQKITKKLKSKQDYKQQQDEIQMSDIQNKQTIVEDLN